MLLLYFFLPVISVHSFKSAHSRLCRIHHLRQSYSYYLNEASLQLVKSGNHFLLSSSGCDKIDILNDLSTDCKFYGQYITDVGKYLKIACEALDEENWEEAALGGFGVAAECLRKLNSRLIHNSGYILDVANLFDEASSATGCIFMAGLSAGPSFTSAGKALGLHGEFLLTYKQSLINNTLVDIFVSNQSLEEFELAARCIIKTGSLLIEFVEGKLNTTADTAIAVKFFDYCTYGLERHTMTCFKVTRMNIIFLKTNRTISYDDSNLKSIQNTMILILKLNKTCFFVKVERIGEASFVQYNASISNGSTGADMKQLNSS
eukprot:gene14283-30391_t